MRCSNAPRQRALLGKIFLSKSPRYQHFYTLMDMLPADAGSEVAEKLEGCLLDDSISSHYLQRAFGVLYTLDSTRAFAVAVAYLHKNKTNDYALAELSKLVVKEKWDALFLPQVELLIDKVSYPFLDNKTGAHKGQVSLDLLRILGDQWRELSERWAETQPDLYQDANRRVQEFCNKLIPQLSQRTAHGRCLANKQLWCQAVDGFVPLVEHFRAELESFLEDGDHTLWQRAVYALATLRHPDSFGKVCASWMMRPWGGDEGAMRFAIDQLPRWKDPSCGPFLLSLLDVVREEATKKRIALALCNAGENADIWPNEQGALAQIFPFLGPFPESWRIAAQALEGKGGVRSLEFRKHFQAWLQDVSAKSDEELLAYLSLWSLNPALGDAECFVPLLLHHDGKAQARISQIFAKLVGPVLLAATEHLLAWAYAKNRPALEGCTAIEAMLQGVSLEGLGAMDAFGGYRASDLDLGKTAVSRLTRMIRRFRQELSRVEDPIARAKQEFEQVLF
ncbi:MAG: hypothetical protein H6728_13315 [Myxococcales bacterium]|nr:hypothetical protein [Myxococcales bacterium]